MTSDLLRRTGPTFFHSAWSLRISLAPRSHSIDAASCSARAQSASFFARLAAQVSLRSARSALRRVKNASHASRNRFHVTRVSCRGTGPISCHSACSFFSSSAVLIQSVECASASARSISASLRSRLPFRSSTRCAKNSRTFVWTGRRPADNDARASAPASAAPRPPASIAPGSRGARARPCRDPRSSRPSGVSKPYLARSASVLAISSSCTAALANRFHSSISRSSCSFGPTTPSAAFNRSTNVWCSCSGSCGGASRAARSSRAIRSASRSVRSSAGDRRVARSISCSSRSACCRSARSAAARRSSARSRTRASASANRSAIAGSSASDFSRREAHSRCTAAHALGGVCMLDVVDVGEALGLRGQLLEARVGARDLLPVLVPLGCAPAGLLEPRLQAGLLDLLHPTVPAGLPIRRGPFRSRRALPRRGHSRCARTARAARPAAPRRARRRRAAPPVHARKSAIAARAASTNAPNRPAVSGSSSNVPAPATSRHSVSAPAS